MSGMPYKPAGSVVNMDELARTAEEYKRNKVEEAAKKKDSEAPAEKQEEKAQPKFKIKGQEKTVDELIKEYPKIWEQIESKLFLTRNFVEAEVVISDKLEIGLRTLNRLTRSFLMRVFDKNEETAAETGALQRFNELELICMVSRIGRDKFESLDPIVTRLVDAIDRNPDAATVKKAFGDFLDERAVKTRQAAIRELGDQIYMILSSSAYTLNDLVAAFILKDAENPFVLR